MSVCEPPVQPSTALDDSSPLPRLAADVTLRQVGPTEFVVKVGAKRAYYRIGEAEYFLLSQLAESTDVVSLRRNFQSRFGERLSRTDLRDFLEQASSRHFVTQRATAAVTQVSAQDHIEDESDEVEVLGKQSILYYRVPLIDPDQFLSKVVPWCSWIWTRGFLVVSALAMLLALWIVSANGAELASSFVSSMRWESAALAWITVLVVTALHEMAHGATCKHFGGEVHESGLLFLFFMPCMYCNVSDSWLIREKTKRLLITAAGGYSDLCCWAIAVFIWRLTVQDTLINYLSFIVLTVCGTRGLINFNPLLRLDGYYLLSDFLEVPNLYKRGREYWMGHLRSLLWGAAAPPREASGKWLLAYGAMCWVFAILFLDVIFVRVLKYAGDEFGLLGLGSASLLGLYAVRRVFKGFFRSEFMSMITLRHYRAKIWIVAVVVGVAAMFLVPIRNYATGNFEIRPGRCVEVSAPLSSFVGKVLVEDGAFVQAGALLVELHAPDLQSQIETKEAELRQSDANLAKLTSGTRLEELTEQEARVRRLQAWYELGRSELEAARKSLEHELASLDHRIQQARAELENAEQSYRHSEKLYRAGALAGSELQQERTNLAVLKSQLGSADSEYQARATNGVRAAAAEFSRREQDLADAQAKLSLMRIGTRPEEIAAEQARRERVIEELKFLNDQRTKMQVHAPADGIVSAPRLREKVGHFVVQGTLLCHIEDTDQPHVEIAIAEDDALHVRPGQPVRLKARALPFQTFEAVVERVAPAAGKQNQNSTHSVVLAHCRLNEGQNELKSGMTGFGRISRGWNTIGMILVSKSLGYVRTEFWW